MHSRAAAHLFIKTSTSHPFIILSSPHQQVDDLLAQLGREPGILVRVDATQGSVPREAGSWMGVFAAALVGTIGGGHLEFEAIKKARALLATPSGTTAASKANHSLRFALGPSLGQCCGGVVHLQLERLDPLNAESVASCLRGQLQQTLRPLALFGGGHVGHALVQVLANLPFALTWIDSRDGVFPHTVPANVVCEHSNPVHSAVNALAPKSSVLIMSFSHAEDLDVVAACLQRQRARSDLPYIGLIGSKTKWATFRNRLEARGFTPEELAQVTSPIGIPGIDGKEPEVIAVAVAAQLLQSMQSKQ